jgi:hypothetical protein
MTKSDPILIKPASFARDALDFAYATVYVALGLLAAFCLAVLVYFLLSRLGLFTVEGRIRAALLIAFAPLLLFPLFNIWFIVVDVDGIRFRRLLGWPRFLHWADIATIEPATRRDVFVDGWLWPPFPPREITTAMTTLGHFRITSKEGRYLFYPPVDSEVFLEAVKRFGPPNPPIQPTGYAGG